MTTAEDPSAILAELSSAGTPWLAISMAGPAGQSRLALSAADATVIDIADPHAMPVTVNPLEPGPGYPVQAHTDRVAGLFEAAFGLADPVAAAVRAGLRRAYANCGWDSLTGTAAPGAVTPPAVPAFRQLRLAVLDAAEELGYSKSMRASVRAFLRARLHALWAGPAGRFLEGGHPADIASLLRGNVLVANGGVADDEAESFLAGVLLLRLAEHLRPCGGIRHPGGSHARGETAGNHGLRAGRFTVVIASAGSLPGYLAGPAARPAAAEWFSRLLGDIRSCGADVIVAPTEGGDRFGETRPGGPASGRLTPRPGRLAETTPPLLLGRRSAACGQWCRYQPCNGYELRAAGLLADDDGQAWLRLWVQTLVLAFLTARPVPLVPVPLRSGWQALSPRRRECLLATVIDGAVTARATALRPCYDPRRLTSVIAAVAGRMLEDSDPVLFRAGHVWVIPQLRWLHEMERVNPLGQSRIRFDDVAPPLDFGLAGLPDWPGIRVGDRLGGLRRHPLSCESERNRGLATVALLGDDGRAGLDADLATAAMGLSPLLRLRYAARMMGVGARGREPGWLEVVLSWPSWPHLTVRPGPGLARAAARDRIASTPR